MPKAYLTIDDSPTKHTVELTDWLLKNDIPAVFFCIGSEYTDINRKGVGMAQNPAPILDAIKKGFVVANHTYTHRRSSEISYEEVLDEIEKTESLIEGLYKQAGVARKHKLIRFPHLDRGAGGWIVDFTKSGPHEGVHKSLFFDGLNVKPTPPTNEQLEKKIKIQDYLKREGYTAEVFSGVTHPWYAQTEIAEARDSLMTFSTSDWMLNPDFTKYSEEWGWPFKTLDALKGKIDSDAHLWRDDSRHVILAHDHNGLFETTRDLVAHMKHQGMEFVAI
ncbi:MAG: polysaccharide deacetylase family protein [Alphaproteobacteria bacterium]|nr:polysaccharide deacetylase family protein [Alphaproteobacteria bacterium]